MKKRKTIWILVGILLCLTAVLALVHSTTRDKVPEGALLIQYQGKSDYLSLAKLPRTEVSGSIVNGKGEEKEIREEGVSLADVLDAAGIDAGLIQTLTAVADDEFSAELSADEVRESGKAFLALEEDGSMKLIVFGDSNAKRNVRNVVKLVIR